VSAHRLYGVLVTFRRPEALAITLERLAEQDRPLDHLIVVDNAPSTMSRAAVTAQNGIAGSVEHLEMGENLGFAGGVAAGMRRALELAGGDDWIVVLDDDDPVPYPDVLSELEGFAERMRVEDPSTAAVGISGGRFDWRRARIRRVPDAQLDGPVRVEYVAGNQIPFYRVAAVRAMGTFHAPLFFGLSEIEFGLRLHRAGYSLYGKGDLWYRRREAAGRLGLDVRRPSRRLSDTNWRRYYVLRNTIYMLKRFGHPMVALRVTGTHLAKPLLNVAFEPRLALQHLALNLRACRDGWAGRMGRRLEPGSDARHARKAGATPVQPPEGSVHT
jgi:rhamnopyranosyl-N-acetylglucosaminyl-diphospho-decaprenol beta-1,3/1,4-galactofuranosyltransferase